MEEVPEKDTQLAMAWVWRNQQNQNELAAKSTDSVTIVGGTKETAENVEPTILSLIFELFYAFALGLKCLFKISMQHATNSLENRLGGFGEGTERSTSSFSGSARGAAW